jgi:hypothetical protein
MKNVWMAAVLLIASSVGLNAAPILINSSFINGSFENGNQASGCPTGWSCTPTPGWTSFVNNIQIYTALPAGNGNAFGSGPTFVEGPGSMSQMTSIVLVSGQDYTLDFFVGTPIHTTGLGPGQCGPGNPQCFALPVNLFSVTFSDATTLQTLATFVYGAGQPNGALPSIGTWAEKIVTFTSPVGGNSLLATFHSEGGTTSSVVNIDIPANPATVPEPSSMTLLGLGLVGLGTARRFVKKS